MMTGKLDNSVRYWGNYLSPEPDFFAPNKEDVSGEPKTITFEELPEPLQQLHTAIEKGPVGFGMDRFLVEYEGVYGLSLEEDIYSDQADDLDISYSGLVEGMKEIYEKAAGKYKSQCILFDEKRHTYYDGTTSASLFVFLPWYIDLNEAKEIDNYIGGEIKSFYKEHGCVEPERE
jgi:hypothetical protein